MNGWTCNVTTSTNYRNASVARVSAAPSAGGASTMHEGSIHSYCNIQWIRYKYKNSLFIRVKYEIRSVKVPRKMIGRSVAVKVTFTLKNNLAGLQKMVIGARKSDFPASSFCRYKQTVLYLYRAATRP